MDMITEFYPGSRDANTVVFDHYHYNCNIQDTRPRPYKQPQLFHFNTLELDHRNHVRQKDLHLRKSISCPVPYGHHPYRYHDNFYTRNDRNSKLIFNLSSSYAQQKYHNLYRKETMPMCFSPSPLLYQMNFNPIYRNPHTYPVELNNSNIVYGENIYGLFMPISITKNRCKPANRKENKQIRKVKTCCTKFFAPLVKIFPVIRALGSFLSRTTDVGTDVLFATHLCSITGTCDCVWAERGAYGWPPWKDYNWGPTACWQTCSQYQTLEISVTNATNEYPTHYCFAKEDESGCSASPSSSGFVHPLWCKSAITFIAVPLLVINCLYIYKARHLKIFKKIPVLLILLGIIPIFHFIWPVSYILQPILGECADFCHDITITTRIAGAIFESVPQFCLQNFVIMQSLFGDVVGIDSTLSPMAYFSVLCSLGSNAYAVSCFMGKDTKDKVVKFIATFITVGVRVTVNSMYGRHTFGLWMYILPMTSAFLFICICNFTYGLFCCKFRKRHTKENSIEIKINHFKESPNGLNLDERKEKNYAYNAYPIDLHFSKEKEINNAPSKETQSSDHHSMFQDIWKTLGMYVVSATCDGFSANGLLAWIAFMPWVIWPFLDNMAIGMLEPGFTISVSVLSLACAGVLLNIVILICNRCKT